MEGFPVGGFRFDQADEIHEGRQMADFLEVKVPSALGNFFSGLKIAVSYSVVGAVIAEWLGGFIGLGVYMTRVKKSLSYDKMFAVILLVSAISLLLMAVVKVIQYKAMPWEHTRKE